MKNGEKANMLEHHLTVIIGIKTNEPLIENVKSLTIQIDQRSYFDIIVNEIIKVRQSSW